MQPASFITQVDSFVRAHPKHFLSVGVDYLGKSVTHIKEQVVPKLPGVDNLGTFTQKHYKFVAGAAIGVWALFDSSWGIDAALGAGALILNKLVEVPEYKEKARIVSTDFASVHALKVGINSISFFYSPIPSLLGIAFDSLSILKHADIITKGRE